MTMCDHEFQYNIEAFYMKAPLNDIVMKLAEGIHKLKYSEVEEFRCELKYEYNSEERITAEFNTDFFTSIEHYKKSIGSSQIQLLMYLLIQWREFGGKEEFLLESKDYFAKRGIVSNKGNKDRLERDLTILSTLSIQAITRRKKQIEYIDSFVLKYEKEKNGYYKIRFGSWVKNVSYRLYTLLHKNFFNFHSSHDTMAILLSLKLSQLAKLQFRNPKSNTSIKFNTIFSYLQVSEIQIKKQGSKHYLKKLESVCNQLQKQMSFLLSFDCNQSSLTGFLQNKLYYNHSELRKYYSKSPLEGNYKPGLGENDSNLGKCS